ncbi:hypothetical protein K490DRAFT_41905 [Saccharata proteae CBS 121410]|uniref:F-box domain-containing protein n=1 Tax=Saccharata proteae CBS 121410 TaxID=1314787 RepID=A0A9P4HVZ5_9PEZI|nr:hypothetical protein K490DRAFT_41905 [Saccharata proteae CBS 121410]
MPLTCDRLPFDVLFQISTYLSLLDVVHWAQTSRQLHFLLAENTLCRRVIENNALYTRESRLAARKEITHVEALKRIYRERDSFAAATPQSAHIIGYGSAFIYNQGVVCYLSDEHIHVRNVRNLSEPEKVIPVRSILPQVSSGGIPEITLLYYSEGFLSASFEYEDDFDSGNLIILDLNSFGQHSDTTIRTIRLPCANKLFVRNDANYLYYGTHSGTGTHGHHEWKIKGISLKEDTEPLPPDIPALQLDDFVGSDIGSTVAFEIHDNNFYAVSNQTSFDVEEVDWTSFYHCIRFALHNPIKEALVTNTTLYRRQHAEGPINDSWTDLTLQVDPSTNVLKIVEARREWLNGGSKQHRTFYHRPITFPPPPPQQQGDDANNPTQPAAPLINGASSAQPMLLPTNDPMTSTLGSGNNPHYAPEELRYLRDTHPEYYHTKGQETTTTINSPPSPPSPSSFTLSRTKYRTYNLATAAFLDLVEDHTCCSSSSTTPTDIPCLRLRIGSRRKGKEKAFPTASSGANVSSSPSPSLPPEDRFRYSPVRLWPPSAASSARAAALHAVMNAPPKCVTACGEAGNAARGPGGNGPTLPMPALEVEAASDGANVVFLRRPKYSYVGREGPIVVVGFGGAGEGMDGRAKGQGGGDGDWERRKDSGIGVGI